MKKKIMSLDSISIKLCLFSIYTFMLLLYVVIKINKQINKGSSKYGTIVQTTFRGGEWNLH